jgi:hypothetical protein
MVKIEFKIDIVCMREINYFKIFFTIHDDVAADVRWVLMWYVLIDY